MNTRKWAWCSRFLHELTPHKCHLLKMNNCVPKSPRQQNNSTWYCRARHSFDYTTNQQHIKLPKKWQTHTHTQFLLIYPKIWENCVCWWHYYVTLFIYSERHPQKKQKQQLKLYYNNDNQANDVEMTWENVGLSFKTNENNDAKISAKELRLKYNNSKQKKSYCIFQPRKLWGLCSN